MGVWLVPDGSRFEGRYERGRRKVGKFTSADGLFSYDGSYDSEGRKSGKGCSVLKGMYEYKARSSLFSCSRINTT